MVRIEVSLLVKKGSMHSSAISPARRQGIEACVRLEGGIDRCETLEGSQRKQSSVVKGVGKQAVGHTGSLR